MNKENKLKFEKVFKHFNHPKDSLKLKKGVYFLKITSSGKVDLGRFVKE